MKRIAILLSLSPALFGYSYYYTDNFPNVNSYWTQNGSLSGGSSGLTASGTSGAVISTLTVPYTAPATPGMYEVNATFNFAVSGGTYIEYLDASSNALSGSSGTFYSVELTPTVSGGACSATMNINRSVSGSITTLYSATVGCSTNTNLRAVRAQGSVIVVYINNIVIVFLADGTITSGQPGVGVSNTPSGNSLVSASLGQLDVVAPNPVNASSIRTSSFPNQVNMQWQGTTDAGVGLAFYLVYRYYAGNWTFLTVLGALQDTFTDNTASPNTSYVYGIFPYDFHMNAAGTGAYVTTPPSGAVDPRRVGVRSTGAYWGASPEQLDVLSGNLSYSVPLLSARGRSASVGFSLSYNSQNWRQDPGGVWNLGDDVGYGYGWSLMAGSLTPYWNGYFVLDHYTFTDATGAQYQLNVNNGNVWTSTQSIYLAYDANAGILHFPDGTFWVFGCESAGTEQDSGTLYPTVMEDTNGNQITITYANGIGVGWGNSSARIQTIEDVRVPSGYSYTYSFTYNGDPIPHLTQITNSIGTGEAYNFSYTGFTLTDPFTGTSFGSSTALAQVTLPNDSPANYQLTVDGSGELTQATTIYGGYISWGYSPFTYVGSRIQREVTSRNIYDGTTLTGPYSIAHETDDGNHTVHAQTTISDPSHSGSMGQKIWDFSQSSATIGLVTTYQGNDLTAGWTKIEEDFTWTPDSVGNYYIGTVVTKHDPGTSLAIQHTTTQALDAHGNVTQVVKYNYSGINPPSLTYTYSYLTDGNYTGRYIFNRLTSATVTDGTNNETLASISYDGGGVGSGSSPTPGQWDSNYASIPYRGNPTSVTTPSGLTTSVFDMYGNVSSTTSNGVTSTISTTSATNYAAPSSMTVGSLTTNLSYAPTSFLGVTNETGPNGTSVSLTYDSNARVNTVTSPFSAVTTTTHNDTASPPNICTTVTNTSSVRWTQTNLDGFGRPVRRLAGTGSSCGSNILTDAKTAYGPAGVSPLGMVSSQEVPHTYGSSASASTTYSYDGIGRTINQSTGGSDTDTFTSYNYYNAWVQVIDAQSKWKAYAIDAYGNLFLVEETEPSGATDLTWYSYDPLGHLTNVSMSRSTGTQTRSFTYSGNNLTSASNPENGTLSYTYDPTFTNKVKTRTDAKGQVTQYSYDSLARLTEVQYYPSGLSGGEDSCQRVLYYYDGNNPLGSSYPTNAAGHLSASQYYGGHNPGASPACDTTFTELYTYGVPGSPTGKQLVVSRSFYLTYVGNVTYPVSFTETVAYDTEGRMTSLQNPSMVDEWSQTYTGATLGYTYDGMGRLYSMSSGSQSIIAAAAYGPANELTSITGASGGWGGEAHTYNSIKQLIGITSAGLSVSYAYPYSNNGKISSQTDAVSGETVTYAYDTLNRLASASSNASWSQTFAYDGFGNLTAVNGTSVITAGGICCDGNNHAGGEDANGNPGTINLPGYGTTSGATYDVENRLVQTGSNTIFYSYAPGNRRVWRGNGSWVTQASLGTGSCNTGQWSTDEVTFWGLNGKKLGTFQLTESPMHNGVGGCLFTASPTGTNYYFGGKLISNASGWVYSDRLNSIGKFYPYGVERSTTGNNTEKFTGYYRDAETGNDYAVNRYITPGLGRFLTPDRKSGHPGTPGTWNKYAYVGGDPINNVDPDGQQYCPGGNPDRTDCVSDAECSSILYNLDPYEDSPDLANTCVPGNYVGDHGGDDGEGVDPSMPTYFDSITSTCPPNCGNTSQGFWSTVGNALLSAGNSLLNGVTALPQIFIGGFDNLLLNDNPLGIAQIGGSLLLSAIPVAGEFGGTGVAVETGAFSQWNPSITRGSVPNIQTNVNPNDALANLVANGYPVVGTGVSNNGGYTVLSNGDTTYTLYNGTSTGGPSLMVFNPSTRTTTGKIRLTN